MAMHVTNDVRKLLAWLEGAPVPEAQIVAAGFNHTLDKALMLNFVEMNLPKATVSITARGLAANALKATNISWTTSPIPPIPKPSKNCAHV
jgi:hypothetical protein